ncbi:hypothetical protein N008_19225 [Hymenobacter sp. APR13]|nr:hypothetical protein N008_19225 [Hymenobacter sp. APR13]
MRRIDLIQDRKAAGHMPELARVCGCLEKLLQLLSGWVNEVEAYYLVSRRC